MSRYLVGGRVLKTALAVTLAIFITQQLGLEQFPLAAIVALLTVQRTFYYSLVKSLSRVGSVLLGAILGTAFSYLFGVTPIGYGLLTLAAIYICLRLQWQDHIVLASVTAITVLFSGSNLPLSFSIEQILTALLGSVCALAVNFLFTPNHRKEVLQKLRDAEKGLYQIIDLIIEEILHPGCDDQGFKDEVYKLRNLINNGLEVAKLLREEQRFVITRETDSDLYRDTFRIYRSQLERLEEMHRLARRMPIRVPQAKPIAQLFRVVRRMELRQLSGKTTLQDEVNRIMEKLEQSFAEMDLPQSREEFVSRASLFHLFQEIKRYYHRNQKLPAIVLVQKKRR